jgi:enterochelin esterase family protein
MGYGDVRRRGAAGVAVAMAAAALLTAVGATEAAMPPALKVVGARVQDDAGQRVRLRGVNAASLEWSSDGEGHILRTVETAVKDWRANVVRLPLSQDRWFGKAPEQTDGGTAYRALVRKVVDACADRGAYVILDLHWSGRGEWGKDIGQHKLPDENSVAFWKDAAAAYKDHPAVLFGLYNEPHDVSWDTWLNGGDVTEQERKDNAEKTYRGVGMRRLLDTVRATGAKNVVVVGGLDWSYDFSGILDNRRLADPQGRGVIYDNHAYPFKGETVEKWVARMEKATATLPVLVGEFGSDPKGGAGLSGEEWVRAVLAALKGHDWDWTAWDLHPAAGPTLISDWDYTPTPHFGVWVKQALAAGPPPATAAPSAASPAVMPKRYALGPDSLPRDGVPKGRLEGPFLFQSKVLAGTIRKYWVYVPAQYSPTKPAAVLVFQDGQRAVNPNGVLRVPNVLDNLIAKREIPVIVGIFVTPGQRGNEYPDSLGMNNPNNRSAEYDALGDAYARFVVDELLPEVGKRYALTTDPAGRVIGGASSGAIAAFTVAWERPEAFRGVVSLIGSFTDIRGGHVYPDLVRKADRKPLRVFLQDGVYDNRNPENPKRDWHLQNQAMLAALTEKGYDVKHVFGEGGHSDDHGGALLPDILRWMWRDYPK